MSLPQTSPATLIQEKKQLRKELRQQRRQLTKLQQRTASTHLLKNLKRFGLLLRGKHIALYLGNDGEICPRSLVTLIQKWGKTAYLPVIHPLKPQQMIFCQVSASSPYIKNRFGIEEPDFKRCKQFNAKQLSTVLMPLVAFDSEGNRMGMGGGFYDRTFDYKRRFPQRKPRLIGLAHELQKMDALPVNDWDVSLDAIVTDQGIYAKK